MNPFISDAWAQSAGGAGAPPGAGFIDFLPLLLLIAIFYFMLIRPQMKRQKEHKKMVEALAKGDEVVTSGGLLGRITDVGENFVAVELAKGVEVKVQKHLVAQVMPKGTLESA